MVEGARLEIVCAVIPYPGFKSLTLRHKNTEIFEVSVFSLFEAKFWRQGFEPCGIEKRLALALPYVPDSPP